MSSKNEKWWLGGHRTPVILEIEHVAREAKSAIHRRDAQAFVDYFVRNGYLTEHMKKRGRELSELSFGKRARRKKKNRKVWARHYLYAITDGEALKVGFSKNPETRVKQMSTGSRGRLKVVWQALCAYNNIDARAEEKKLHRRLQRHKIDREWFGYDCLIICRQWRVYGMEDKKQRYLDYLEGFDLETLDNEIDRDLDLETCKEMQRIGL